MSHTGSRAFDARAYDRAVEMMRQEELARAAEDSLIDRLTARAERAEADADRLAALLHRSAPKRLHPPAQPTDVEFAMAAHEEAVKSRAGHLVGPPEGQP